MSEPSNPLRRPCRKAASPAPTPSRPEISSSRATPLDATLLLRFGPFHSSAIEELIMHQDPGLTRRRFCEIAAAGAAAAQLGLAAFPAEAQQEGGDAVRPFQFSFPDADLAELRRRINAARWPDPE